MMTTLGDIDRESRVMAPPFDFDGNRLGTDAQVLAVLKQMEVERIPTDAEWKMGRRTVRQVLPVTNFLPSSPDRLIVQGRGLGAGAGDESYLGAEGDDPLNKGLEAVFAATVATGVHNELHPGHQDDTDIRTGVMVIGLPGISIDTTRQNAHRWNHLETTTRLSPPQFRGLLRGDHAPVADAKAIAIRGVLHRMGNLSMPLHIVGASTTTAQAPRIGAQLLASDTHVASIDLIDPVSLELQKRWRLLGGIARARESCDEYMGRNHLLYQRSRELYGDGRASKLSLKLSRVTMAVYGWSLGPGGLLAPLYDPDTMRRANDHGTVINLAYGRTTEFDVAKPIERAKKKLEDFGYENVITTPFPGPHAVTTNAPVFVETVKRSIAA